MRVEIVVIGNELLSGDLADTNTARMAGWLRQQGLPVSRGQTVPDEEEAIVAAFTLAASRADLVLVSGGLGPTSDDLTMAAAARWRGRPLIQDDETLAGLRARFAARGFRFTENNAKQALAPKGAELLDNPVGTAPCVRLSHGGTTFFFFPGVPRELERLVADHLAPWVAAHVPVRPLRSAVLKTFGKPESHVAALLGELPGDPRLHVAYRAHFPEIQVTFHVDERDEAAATALLDRLLSHARAALGPLIYSDDKAATIADAVGEALVGRGATLALAESCTGGLVAKLCTDVPGASAWLLESAVTYANDAKTRRLGVSEALLAERGAVSEEVARAMAEGARATAGADYAVAVTGIAGPAGGTPDKPVGTVHFAVAGPGGTVHKVRRYPFGRSRNRVVSAWFALDLARRVILGLL